MTEKSRGLPAETLADDQHRGGAVQQDVPRHAAEEEAAQTGPSARSHDAEVGIPGGSLRNDLRRGVAASQRWLRCDTGRPERVGARGGETLMCRARFRERLS